ncbi:MAG: type 4a pilus biogenesis protein PilO [Acidobacteriota bacterium]
MDLQSLPWYGQFGVFLLIGAVLFGFFYYLHYSPTQDTIVRVENDIDEVERKIRKAEREEGRLKQIKEEIANYEATLEELKTILPEKNEVSQIIKKIQSIISSARLKIGKFVKQKESKKEIYIQVPYQITLAGTYHNLGVFFDQLSRLKKIFTVNSLSINPIKKKISDYSINASFTTSTYIYREPKVKKKRPGSRRGRRG